MVKELIIRHSVLWVRVGENEFRTCIIYFFNECCESLLVFIIKRSFRIRYEMRSFRERSVGWIEVNEGLLIDEFPAFLK